MQAISRHSPDTGIHHSPVGHSSYHTALLSPDN